jgi:hypothetical protein
LAQHYKLSRAASLLSAVAFGFCGYLAAWVMLPTLANTASWLPLLMWNAECGMRNKEDSKFSVLLEGRLRISYSALLACAFLAGHPQVFFFLLLALVLQACFAEQRARAFSQLIFSGAVALLLSTIQLLPTLELARLGHRAGSVPTTDGWNGIVERALYWSELTSLALPDWFLHQGTLNENFGYVGVGVCLLALGALVFAKQIQARRVFAFACALTLLGLLYALATPLPQLLYWTVPGLSQMGGVGRALFLTSLGLALLAGFGLDALRSKIKSPIVPIIALLIVTAELFTFGWSFQPTAPRAAIYPRTQVTRFLQANVKNEERVWFVTPRESWAQSEALQQMQVNHPPGVLPPNGAMVYGLNDINGYDSLAPRAYREWLTQFIDHREISPEYNGNMVLLDKLPAATLDAMKVRYVVSLRPRDEIGETMVLNAENCFVYQRKIAEVRQVSGADWYPGWKDGKYQPESFRLGGFLSLCALSFLVSICIFRLKQRPSFRYEAPLR